MKLPSNTRSHGWGWWRRRGRRRWWRGSSPLTGWRWRRSICIRGRRGWGSLTRSPAITISCPTFLLLVLFFSSQVCSEEDTGTAQRVVEEVKFLGGAERREGGREGKSLTH